MKPVTKLLMSVLLVAVTGNSAANQPLSKATFDVEKMSCATCPITVRTAMQRVKGVSEVRVDFESKSATVTYDPNTTTVQEIADASSNIGFPAHIKEDPAE